MDTVKFAPFRAMRMDGADLRSLFLSARSLPLLASNDCSLPSRLISVPPPSLPGSLLTAKTYRPPLAPLRTSVASCQACAILCA